VLLPEIKNFNKKEQIVRFILISSFERCLGAAQAARAKAAGQQTGTPSFQKKI
jgi:hypothetical protein